MLLARRSAFLLARQLSCGPAMVMAASRPLCTSPYLKASDAPASDARLFSDMEGKLDSSLLESIKEVMGFEYMTPVQDKVLNGLPSLKSDWYAQYPTHGTEAHYVSLVHAKTGTGKTTAFLLPAIQTLLQNSPPRGQVSVLILSPTRELALQIAAEANKLVSKLRRPVEIHTAYGGSARAQHLRTFLEQDPKILVATPGRLKDYLTEQEIRKKFEDMQTLILDEGDMMLEAGTDQHAMF